MSYIISLGKQQLFGFICILQPYGTKGFSFMLFEFTEANFVLMCHCGACERLPAAGSTLELDFCSVGRGIVVTQTFLGFGLQSHLLKISSLFLIIPLNENLHVIS